ncbi:MAG TPA: DMT family transporter [Gaiellaceae bacterium]|nr:DMT family transporter [Gaiellaceae bacterium]
MSAIVLALGASLTWGLADFFGPLQGRVLGALRTLVYVQVGGLAGIALIVAVRAKGPDGATALLAAPAAVSGTLGLFAYYRGIAVGAISIVAPIAGISAIVPVIVGIVSGDRPSVWQLLGIACALVGVFLAAREPGRGGTRFAAGVGLAMLAAIGFGGYFPFMHAAGNADFWWASLIFRLTSTSVILLAVAAQRPALGVPRRILPWLVLIGLGDMFGNLLYAAASTSGLVSIT